MILKYIKYHIVRHPKLARKAYQYCKQYVDQYNGENNHDIKTNGEFLVMQQLCHTSKIVFDIGANVGDWTRLALSINQNLAIHCFEPCKNAYNTLLQNNFPSKVVLNNTGLSSKETTANMYLFEADSPLNSLYQRNGLENVGLTKPIKKEKVTLTTLDNYCQTNNIRYIDFAKIDVEGHELDVLRGAKKMLAEKKIRYIQFEYGGCYIDARILLKDIFDLFKTFNYTLFKILPDRIKRVNSYTQDFENFQLQNWLATAELIEEF